MSKVEDEDEVEVVVMDEVEISTTTPIMPKEKTQPEDEAKAIQDQGMTNLKYSAIIVKSLGIMLQNPELQVPELRREWTMLQRKMVKMAHFY